MSYTAGPIALSAGVPVVQNNPAVNSGNLSSQAAVIVNLSPFELIISSGAGNTVAVVDPMTRDIVPLDPTSGQQISIDPLSVGLQGPSPLAECFVTWYQAGEEVPGHYPTAIAAGLGPFTTQVALNTVIATNQVFDLTSQSSVWRSALVVIQNLGAAQVVNINLTTGPSGFILGGYRVVMTSLDFAFIRIPLVPLSSGTLNQKIQLSAPAASINGSIFLDTATVDTPNPVLFGENAASSGSPSGAPTVPNAFAHATLANGGTVLAASTGGLAYYVFGIDAQTVAADIQNFSQGGGGAVFASTQVTAANGLATTGDLGGVRIPTGQGIAYTATNVNQSAGITIRYAIGAG